MRDHFYVDAETRTPIAELSTSLINELLRDGIKISDCSEGITPDDVRERLEIELIARANGWPTKRSS